MPDPTIQQEEINKSVIQYLESLMRSDPPNTEVHETALFKIATRNESLQEVILDFMLLEKSESDILQMQKAWEKQNENPDKGFDPLFFEEENDVFAEEDEDENLTISEKLAKIENDDSSENFREEMKIRMKEGNLSPQVCALVKKVIVAFKTFENLSDAVQNFDHINSLQKNIKMHQDYRQRAQSHPAQTQALSAALSNVTHDYEQLTKVAPISHKQSAAQTQSTAELMRAALGNTTEAYSIFKKTETKIQERRPGLDAPEPVEQKVEQDKQHNKPGHQ